jgi:hypothetical protein
MQFASSPVLQDIGFNTFVPFPDGEGGFFLEGTFELSILDATGIYKRFKGGITTWWIDCINWTRRGRNSTNFASATSAAISSHSHRWSQAGGVSVRRRT